jgi:ABC-2 type transport system ATP-binding protein
VVWLNNLTKRYGAVTAVDGLSLELRPGEVFGFIGPNGAGKTTTIKMLVGILTPDQGRVTVNGFDMTADPVKAKAQIGYVPDNPNLYERLTGMEYLRFIGDVYGVPAEARKERFEKYLGMFELTGAVSSPIRSYSHGMRQKLLLTGALLTQPPLWVLDEPLVGLDPKAALALKEEMKTHCADGNTVFFSTHILEVAEKLCHRIGVIVNGKLVAAGTMKELRAGVKSKSLEKIFFELAEGEGQ